jgi:hypothetical protein
VAILHVKRIEQHLRSQFGSLIDMSDWDGKAEAERDAAFLSRALAAYAITCLCGEDPAIAGKSITDGYDDASLDAIHLHDGTKMLYVIQSKWSKNGTKSIEVGDNLKFLSGFKRLMDGDLVGMNDKIQAKKSVIDSAIYDVQSQFTLVLISTADNAITPPVKKEIDLVLAECNGQGTVLVHFQPFNQDRLYNSLIASIDHSTIDLTINVHEWGIVTDPYIAYYGQVEVGDILGWNKIGQSLFHGNLRNFVKNTEVSGSIRQTLLERPQDFWYFNNGATLLCNSITKQPIYGAGRQKGIFECKGVRVVNGAQTIGTIWDTAQLESIVDPKTRLYVRLISLENCPPAFASEITRAANTQNRIEKRDFAALDPNQSRLAKESGLDGRLYVFRSGDEDPRVDTGFSITDATVALACASGEVGLAVQAKREVGAFWEDIKQEPYTILFNNQLSAETMWRCVKIMRSVDIALKKAQPSDGPKAELVAVHGNRFILYRVFTHKQMAGFRRPDTPIGDWESLAACLVPRELKRVATDIAANHSGSYMQTLFKNANTCGQIDQRLRGQQEIADRKQLPRTLFDDQ